VNKMVKLEIDVSAKIIERISDLIEHNQDDMTLEEKASILVEVGLNYAEDADRIIINKPQLPVKSHPDCAPIFPGQPLFRGKI